MAKILVIDDDEMIRIILRNALESAGHEVLEASNGRSGISIFRQNSPDLIIADILMPDTDGIETITQARNINSDVKIVAISGGSERTDLNFLDYAKVLGAQRTLAKPIDPDVLLEVVEEVLSGVGDSAKPKP